MSNSIHVMLQRIIIKRRQCLNSYYNSNAVIEIQGKTSAIPCHTDGNLVSLGGKKLRWQQKHSPEYKLYFVVVLNKMLDEFGYVFTRVGKLHLLERICQYIYNHRVYLLSMPKFKAAALAKLLEFEEQIKEDELNKFNPGTYRKLLFPNVEQKEVCSVCKKSCSKLVETTDSCGYEVAWIVDGKNIEKCCEECVEDLRRTIELDDDGYFCNQE